MTLRRVITEDKLGGVAFPHVLGAEVFASAKIRGSEVSGLAQIKYVVTQYPNPTSGLVFNNQPVVVHKITEESLDVIEPNLRRMVRSVFPDSVEYDLRALGYCAGRRLAMLSVGKQISMSTAPVMRYSGAVDTFNLHDLAVTPGVLNANGVLTAYAHLASDCNLERLYAVDDRAQLVASDQGIRYWLDVYMKVVNQLCCDAMRQGVLGEMLFSIFRGISCVLKLHSHTDEGGYARRAAYTADYPRPRGWVNAVRDPDAMNIFKKIQKPHARCVLADCLELVLLCVGFARSTGEE